MGLIRNMIVAYVLIAAVVFVGWVMNIVALIHTSFDPLTGLAVARAIGVGLVPLGSVLGYFA